MSKGLIITGVLSLVVLVLPVAAETEGKKLGDESDGSRAHSIHVIPLVTEEGDRIAPDDDPLLPFSMRQTCGECHSYQIISNGLHFNAPDANAAPGRPGQPWIFSDARTGTQIPVSYRPWPGTYKPEQLGLTPRQFTKRFGSHTPGGGAGELDTPLDDEIMREMVSGKLEINCLSCHNADPAHNQGDFAGQIARENFRWAGAATTGIATGSGSAKDMPDTYDPVMPDPLDDPKLVPPTISYKQGIFDSKKQVFFDIKREVPSHRCYFCHSNLYLSDEHTEKWSADEDIHLTAGLNCVDCHRNGIDHNTVRGYEGEASVSKNHLAAGSSCEGCHLGEKSSAEPAAGRFGAPVPEHPGIPPAHFERLTCTACHSGPWPGEETVLTKTSRAHRLGTIGVNKSQEVLPHIISPVFATQGDGKIAPHKLLWPAFWGSLKDGQVEPVAFDTVGKILGETLGDLKRLRSGDWPAFTAEHITNGLKALASDKSIEGTPVYISGGKLHKLDDSGALAAEDHAAAEPYLWPIAHDVRPAAQALGIRYCTDCHAADAPFFFGKVAVDSPVVSKHQDVKKMYDFQDIDVIYARAFAFSFVFRPWMKAVALCSCAVLAAVLLLYVLKALAFVAKLLGEEG